MRVHESTAVGHWRQLRANCWEVFSVAAQVGTYLATAGTLVAATVVVVGWSVSARPPADPPPAEPAEVRRLRSDNEFLRTQLADRERAVTELETDRAVLKLKLNGLLRNAILFPERPDPNGGDMIPPQNLPPAPFPTPAELGVKLP